MWSPLIPGAVQVSKSKSLIASALLSVASGTSYLEGPFEKLEHYYLCEGEVREGLLGDGTCLAGHNEVHRARKTVGFDEVGVIIAPLGTGEGRPPTFGPVL